jgi:hypothetical protein
MTSIEMKNQNLVLKLMDNVRVFSVCMCIYLKYFQDIVVVIGPLKKLTSSSTYNKLYYNS